MPIINKEIYCDTFIQINADMHKDVSPWEPCKFSMKIGITPALKHNFTNRLSITAKEYRQKHKEALTDDTNYRMYDYQK